MRISGLQKLTLLDFPGMTAATIFTSGCGFRCPFCHNADLVVGVPSAGSSGPVFPSLSQDEVLDFLKRRRGLLDGVCITGGEPLMQPDIESFIEDVRGLGFACKLDTNGAFPTRLKSLIDAGLLDYVAMDVKNAPERYAETVGVPGLEIAPIRESIDILLEGAVPFEFRTTVVRELHPAEALISLARWIEGAPAWYLQSFVDADTVMAGRGQLHAWSDSEMVRLAGELESLVPTVKVRGV